MTTKEILHYPNLKTLLAVENVLKNAELVLTREEIKRRLPTGIMHQTLNLILKYFEERNMILETEKGVLWIYNPSMKLKKELKKGIEI
jgi:response regulator of citrate/malate metabolism